MKKNPKIQVRNETEETMLLAGQLALAARKVINANPKNISQRIVDLEIVLDRYDMNILNKIR